MTKSDLIEKVAAQLNLPKGKAELIINCIFDSMEESLKQGNRIEIRGFGSFSLNHRPPRVGRNPRSGERVEVPEKWVPHFKAGKELRERVDAADLTEVMSASNETEEAPVFAVAAQGTVNAL